MGTGVMKLTGVMKPKSIQPRGYGKFGGKLKTQLMYEMAEDTEIAAAGVETENTLLWRNALSLRTFIKSPDVAYAFAESQKPGTNFLQKFFLLSMTISLIKRLARRIKRKRYAVRV